MFIILNYRKNAFLHARIGQLSGASPIGLWFYFIYDVLPSEGQG
jgi:hypothetical protein